MVNAKYKPRRVTDEILNRSLQDIYVILNALDSKINLTNTTVTSNATTTPSLTSTHKYRQYKIDHTWFPYDSSLLAVVSGQTLYKIYLEIVEVFDSGTLNIVDSARTLVDKDYVILTSVEPQEFLQLKTYVTNDNIILELVGTPTAGKAYITIEYT